jgi:thiamine-monophosphate kinase
MMNAIKENELIARLTAPFQRSPLQQNDLQESDAEILYLPGDDPARIAVTIDTISEEISRGLYDPYLAGWMTVMASMSDLAAVGARPLGLVISETLPPGLPALLLKDLQQGLSDAAAACGSYILGGDTNSGERLLLTGCAVGMFGSEKALSRAGAAPGDLLYVTNTLGSGNAFALSRLLGLGTENDIRPVYRPKARLAEGRSLCGIASACMDTSDGLLATLDQMMRVNNAGFELDPGWVSCLDRDSLALAEATGIPPWLLLAGQHGEFELAFTVRPDRREELEARAKERLWRPLRLGSVIQEQAVCLPGEHGRLTLDTERIRNCGFDARTDIHEYLRELLTIDAQLRKGAVTHVSQ